MEQKYPTSLYRSMMNEGDLTEKDYAECGYNKNSTLGDILTNIYKKLNVVENRVFLALVGGASTGLIKEQKVKKFFIGEKDIWVLSPDMRK